MRLSFVFDNDLYIKRIKIRDIKYKGKSLNSRRKIKRRVNEIMRNMYLIHEVKSNQEYEIKI